jgi:hypothetical protein
MDDFGDDRGDGFPNATNSQVSSQDMGRKNYWSEVLLEIG